MTSVYRYCIRRPWVIFAIAGIVTITAGPGVLRLRLRTDGHALVPEDAPAVKFDTLIRQTHGIRDPFVVMIRAEQLDGVYNPSTLRLIDNLTRQFKQLPGVTESSVFSLATEPTYRVRPGTLKFRTFLEDLPETRIDSLRIREDVRRIRLYNGTLVSADRSGATILVGAPPNVDRVAMFARIKEIIAACDSGTDEISVIGAPVAEALLGTHILQDLGVPESVLGSSVKRDDGGSSLRWPRDFYELRMMLGRRIGLVPIAMVIMAAVFLIGFRSVGATLLPLMEVGACLVFVFGLMGWLGVPVYLTIAVMPIILTAMGVADEVHVFHRYCDLLRERGTDDHKATLLTAVQEMSRPVIQTSATTSIGFLSFALSPLAPVRAFGIFTAIGIVFCMAFTLTVLPAALSMMPPSWFISRRHAQSPDRIRRGWFARLGRSVIAGRHVIVVGVAVIVVVASTGAKRVNVQDSWVGGFDEKSDFYRATNTFDQQFLGSHILLLAARQAPRTTVFSMPSSAIEHHRLLLPSTITAEPESFVHNWLVISKQSLGNDPAQSRTHRRDRWETWIERAERIGDRVALYWRRQAGSPTLFFPPTIEANLNCEIRWKPFTSPNVLEKIEAFESYLDGRGDGLVGGAHGPAAYLKTSNFMVDPTREANRSIPDMPARVKWLWEQYERIRGTERLRQVVNADYSQAIITVLLKDANFVDTAKVMDDIRAYEREHLQPFGIDVAFAGDIAVSQTLIGAIVNTQLKSLLLSLAGILVITSVLARSIIWGVCAILPCVLAVLVNFAFMGWTEIPLGVATSMFAGMTLGIGVDFAIHMSERCRFLMAQGADRRAAVCGAIATTGPAILLDALAVSLGFSVMVLSQVPANARLGALVVLSIIICLLATLLVLPACLYIWMRPAHDRTSHELPHVEGR